VNDIMWNVLEISKHMNSFGLYSTLLECMEAVDWFFQEHAVTLQCFRTVKI